MSCMLARAKREKATGMIKYHRWKIICLSPRPKKSPLLAHKYIKNLCIKPGRRKRRNHNMPRFSVWSGTGQKHKKINDAHSLVSCISFIFLDSFCSVCMRNDFFSCCSAFTSRTFGCCNSKFWASSLGSCVPARYFVVDHLIGLPNDDLKWITNPRGIIHVPLDLELSKNLNNFPSEHKFQSLILWPASRRIIQEGSKREANRKSNTSALGRGAEKLPCPRCLTLDPSMLCDKRW